MIVILSGEPGRGKTYQSFGFSEPIRCLDVENRSGKTAKLHYADRLIDVRQVMQTKDGRNYYQSYLSLKKEIDSIVAGDIDFATLIIDGLSDIRSKYAKAKWFHDHPNRKNPLAEEWTEINGMVNGLLEPLIDLASEGRFDMVWTAQFCDQYGKAVKFVDGKPITTSEKLGREPNIENWQEYGVETVIQLEYRQDKKQYWAVCTKSPRGCWDANITGMSLYELLVEQGV